MALRARPRGVHRSRGVVALRATLTTDAAGTCTAAKFATPVFGRIVRVLYDGGLDASAVITIKDAETGATLVAYTTGVEGTPVAFRPTTVVTDNAGTAVTAADTAPNVNRDILVHGYLTIGVASGGNVETGKVAVIVDEEGLGSPALTV